MSDTIEPIEPPLGELYIGGIVDRETGERTGEALFYPARRFTTHGVIVGMTGSGKTGLGIVTLEEALLAGIPALILDPKGDMGNLALAFPELAPEDFRPWIDEAEARRKGVTPEQLAANTAETWREGLASWGIGPERIRRLKEAADLRIYTPGSGAGIPLNIVGSLKAPDLDWEVHDETLRDEIESFVSSLLVLAGVEADPISSPEHILLATIVEHAWREGRDLDLAQLIRQVQEPPFRKLGVFELDTFFPPKERTKLAMRLNGLVASPSFAAWLQGDPLDIDALMHAPDGRPRASILYLTHLTETERQFVVTLILSKVVTWMRRQPGTSDLRALIYMDEVFGFAPPTAEPPSKKPILTILKQARAHGVGMILSTQNPVDLDYKAMSNAGTWMVGRLQTERDKARIVEGIQSATGAVDVKAFDRLISDLKKRHFVLHSTRDPEPRVFTTRWAMSFLAGPLTRDQVAGLMAPVKTAPTPASAAQAAPEPTATPAPSAAAASASAPRQAAAADAGGGATAAEAVPRLGENETLVPPRPPDAIPVYHLDLAAPWAKEVGAVPGGRVFAPAIAARVHLVYDDTRAGIDHTETWEAVFFPLGPRFDPSQAIVVDHDPRDLRTEAPPGAVYLITDAPLDKASYWKQVERAIKDHLYRERKIRVFRNPKLKVYSRPDEDEDAFRSRVRALAEDKADEEVAKLKDRFETRIERVKDQLAAAERRVRELEVDTQERRREEMLSGAGELLGVFLGRRRTSGLSKIARKRSQVRRTQERLQTAMEKLEDKERDLLELEDELAEAILETEAKWEAIADEIEEIEIGLEKTDIDVDEVALLWIPVR